MSNEVVNNNEVKEEVAVAVAVNPAELDAQLAQANPSTNDDDDDLFDEDDMAVELKAEEEEVEEGVQKEGLPNALSRVDKFLHDQESLFMLVKALEALLPKKKKTESPWNVTSLKNFFLGGDHRRDSFNNGFGLNPPSIALITLESFFKDSRFEKVDPRKLPEHSKLIFPYTPPKLMHTTIDTAGIQHTVPIANEGWYRDTKLKINFTVEYEPSPGGGIVVHVYTASGERRKAVEIANDLKAAVMSSPFLKGQILEITQGSDFRIIDIGNQPMPAIEDWLKDELEKNIINLFDQREAFDAVKLPIQRSVILEGPPGCGKTMLARYLAARVRGKVTTIWVTAKSISDSSDVAGVFDLARKLSPSLVIMEDLDLISGTREAMMDGGGNALGEMLNQLDGLEKNHSIVVVGSTNKASSLDEALKDRPGRFDRIYEVGRPGADLAESIAKHYLVQRGIDQAVIDRLDYSVLKTNDKNNTGGQGDWTGAQIVEIVKGALFEAIHRKVTINELCLKASRDGLLAQGRYTETAKKRRTKN